MLYIGVAVQAGTERPGRDLRLESDEALVTLACGGDREAFCSLVRHYEQPVLAMAAGILGSYHDARDIAQDAFLTAYRNLNRLRNRQRFGAWVLQIARRAALRARRHRARQSCRQISPDLSDCRPGPGESEASAQATAMIARLPRHEQVVLSLRYVAGLPVADIARATGRPVGTVTKQLSRAVNRLRSCLKGMDHD